jgi:hypothetical protein
LQPKHYLLLFFFFIALDPLNHSTTNSANEESLEYQKSRHNYGGFEGNPAFTGDR